MNRTEQARLDDELAAATAELDRVLAENAASDERDGGAIKAARNRVAEARGKLALWNKAGATHGVVAEAGQVLGTIAVRLPPGCSSKERERAIDDALGDSLGKAAETLVAVLVAAPIKYTVERRGRDAEGRTVFEVAGRVEGDRLVPAVSRAAKLMRKGH